MMTDELRMRAVTSREIGMRDARARAPCPTPGSGGRVLMVDDRPSSYERMATVLAAEHTVDIEPNPKEALFHAAEGNYDLVIVSLGLENFDGLRLCSQLRSLERTRNVPILAIADAENNRAAGARARDRRQRLSDAPDRQERVAGARPHADRARRRYTEQLRDNVQMSIEMAITDALTGLYNRRYMESHLGDAGRAGGRARQAAGGADAGHRLLQVDQRHLRPRRRRRRAARVLAAHAASRSAASISPAATAAKSSSS